MRLIDKAVTTRLFRRGDRFPIPRRFFQAAAKKFKQSFVERDEWQQVVFLCSDSVYFGFWTKDKAGALDHQIVGINLDQLHRVPGLEALWTWKNIGRTWDSLKAEFEGTTTKDETKAFAPRLRTKNSGPN